MGVGLFESVDNESDYPVGYPHDDDADEDIGDDLSSFLRFLFVTTTDHELESSIDDIEDSDQCDKSEKVLYDSCDEVGYIFFWELVSSDIFDDLWTFLYATAISLTYFDFTGTSTVTSPVPEAATCLSWREKCKSSYEGDEEDGEEENSFHRKSISDERKICKYLELIRLKAFFA
jgi:hypothetical protein